MGGISVLTAPLTDYCTISQNLNFLYKTILREAFEENVLFPDTLCTIIDFRPGKKAVVLNSSIHTYLHTNALGLEYFLFLSRICIFINA